MKILVYGINYYPELTGIGKYTSEMCEWLQSKGHDVTVITGNPYYPEWKIHKGYKNWYKTEVINGVKVYRNPLYVPLYATGFKRILHEITFIISAYFTWLKLLFRPSFDYIICLAPPFHSGLFAIFYRVCKGSKIVYHIQDLQVDAARELDMIKNRFLLDVIEKTEKWILKKVDIVSTISEGMAKKIDEKGLFIKVNIMANWVDTDFIKPLPKKQSLRKQFSLAEDDMVLLYSGNLGEKQGLDIIIESACQLSKFKKIKFLICGSGAYKERLIALAEDKMLSNVVFGELQPLNKLPLLLNTGDVHLILQKKTAADLVLPSKLTGITSSGGMSVVTAETGTTLYDTVKKFNLGLLIEPENSRLLSKAILKCRDSNLSEYRQNARRYAELHLNKDVILNSFIKHLVQHE